MFSSPYLKLMRLHQPTGVWLLLLPCWWGLALASDGIPSPVYLLLFFAGAVLMRGAGCVINDLWDRDFDREVERTRSRPIASGAVSVRQAVWFYALLLALSLAVALALPPIVLWYAVLSLPLVIAYPLMKRVTWWPQAFLGLTFNWGALMGYAAVAGHVAPPALLLYAAGFFWTLGYDTIYAHQDVKDDQRIGVKSTARLLGAGTANWLWFFYGMTIFLLAAAGYFAQLHVGFYALLFFVALHFIWQIRRLDIANPAECMALFISNRWAGLLIFVALVAGHYRFS